MKKIFSSLVFKLILGIIAGILIGSYLPVSIVKVFITGSSIFSSFLKFMIPFIVLAFVVSGIADLSKNAGKLLGLTTALSYGSTVIVGFFTYFVCINVFQSFTSSSVSNLINLEDSSLSSYITLPLDPIMDVTAAIVLAFILGIGISSMRQKQMGETLYNAFNEFQSIVISVLNTVIIPLLPFYLIGTFANMAYSGQIVAVASVFSKVFLTIIVLHWVVISIQFISAALVSKKNPLHLFKNQIPGYITAIGTQSSATTIPINIECAERNGVSKQIREFVIPLCATIHLSGSITSLTSFCVAILMTNNMDYSLSIFVPFIFMVGVVMVAAPGAPGGAIMAALPFLPMIGISSDGALASLLIALYIAQDSFGTAANISGDNAIALIVDTYHKRAA